MTSLNTIKPEHRDVIREALVMFIGNESDEAHDYGRDDCADQLSRLSLDLTFTSESCDLDSIVERAIEIGEDFRSSEGN